MHGIERLCGGGKIQTAIIGSVRAMTGVSNCGRKYDKETWWWNDTIRKEIKVKKYFFFNVKRPYLMKTTMHIACRACHEESCNQSQT